MSGDPYPKQAQLARGEKRYVRKVASPKQWQAIIAAKRGPCRICTAAGVPPNGAVELHHLISRSQGGDDVSDNIVPLCHGCHFAVTQRSARRCQWLAEALTDAERAYIVSRIGADGVGRLFRLDVIE